MGYSGGLIGGSLADLVAERDWRITPKRNFVQCFESSLNAPGWSISLLNMTGISRETDVPIATLFELLDADTNAPAWPKNGYKQSIGASSGSEAKSRKVTAASDKGPQGKYWLARDV